MNGETGEFNHQIARAVLGQRYLDREFPGWASRIEPADAEITRERMLGELHDAWVSVLTIRKPSRRRRLLRRIRRLW